MSLHPYLFFSGTAREAMTRYQEVLGGQLEMMAVADMPAGEDTMDMAGDAIAHAMLTFGSGQVIMGSDDPTGDGAGVKGVALHLGYADLDEVRRVFDQLADGGEVQMPLEPVFWAPLFGACVDRFGVSWMLSGEPDADG